MPQRKVRSREEILHTPFVTQTEVGRLLDLSYRDAKEVFDRAHDRDIEQIGRDRMVHLSKVRLKSVLWAVGLDYGMLEKQVKGGKNGGTEDV